MKISVITVSYNSADTIVNTLRSVSEQTLKEIEHIVIDGRSKDRTVDLVREMGGPHVKLISEPDRGIYDAMNKGVAASTGDIIGFLNADDHYPHPGVLAHVANAFSGSMPDAVFGDVSFFHSTSPQKQIRRYRSDRFSPAAIGWGWMPAHPALFVQRKLFETYGPFKIDYRIAGDFEWVARAFGPGQLRYQYLPEVLVSMQTGGISTRGWRSTLLLNQEVMRACRENNISSNWFKLLSKYPAKVFEFIRT